MNQDETPLDRDHPLLDSNKGIKVLDVDTHLIGDNTPNGAANNFDVVIVGAGFAGMYALYRLRALKLRTIALDSASGVGGTWYWNRYPGCRCDVASLLYSYSFDESLQQEWSWSERFASQPEIERYANHVADRFDLRRDIRLDTEVVAADFDAVSSRWRVQLDDGSTVSCRYFIVAVGGYSAPIQPAIDGLDDFEGELYFTAQWPREDVDFEAKRVGIVGTGSSGMQTATTIAHADPQRLYVFQRTANYCVPQQNTPTDPELERAQKQDYASLRKNGITRWMSAGEKAEKAEKTVELSDYEFETCIAKALEIGGAAPLLETFPDVHTDLAANDRVAEYLRMQVRKRVNDPKTAELLCAKNYPVGTRRFLAENGYLEIFNQDNVELVDVRSSPIKRITSTGVSTDGASYDLDMLILATGFDSGTGSILRINITGLDGETLRDHWAEGPRTLLGLSVSKFPNMFILWGPGSPGIRSNGIAASEVQVDWISRLLLFADQNRFDSIEASPCAEEKWTVHVAQVAASGLHDKNDSQYVGANVPGKPRVYLAYLGGVPKYREFCDRVASDGYAGLSFGRDGAEVRASPSFSTPDVSGVVLIPD
jgi:cyclohexanone monooxygenase